MFYDAPGQIMPPLRYFVNFVQPIKGEPERDDRAHATLALIERNRTKLHERWVDGRIDAQPSQSHDHI